MHVEGVVSCASLNECASRFEAMCRRTGYCREDSGVGLSWLRPDGARLQSTSPVRDLQFFSQRHHLLDAGTIGSRLYIEEQKRIRLVLLTHLHFNHIRDLPTL